MSWMDVRFRKMLLAAAVLGVGVGLFGAAFTWVWHGLEELVWHHLSRPADRIWVSALAGLVIGLILMWLHDPGSMATIVYHFHKSGKLPMHDNLPIQPVSLMGLVAGQSAGPEGALTQAGGSLGAWFAMVIRTPTFQRVLTLAGMGAGFGAFLGAPVGGAVLWLEMLHTRGLEYFEAVVPTLVCSCVAYLTMVLLVGHGVVQPWHVALPDGSAVWWTPLLAVGVGVACGPIAKGYALLFRQVGKAARAVRGPMVLRTMLAGLIIGVLGYFVPLSYFYGSKQMPELFNIHMSSAALLGLLAAKMLAASVTVRGHWQGGLIIPHMFMGAAFGKLLAMWVPGLDPTLAMLCGMAGFNAAATQTPLSSAMIVLALTGYSLPAPIFLASVAGFLAGQGVVVIENKQARTEPINFHLEPVESQIVP